MTGPRAVLLDALGTLLALEDPSPPLIAQLAEHGIHISDEQAREAMLAEMTYYRAHHDEATDARSLDELRDRCTAVLAAALPPVVRELTDLDDALDLKAALLASLRFTAFPEVPGVLRELRARGARLVVVSNWDVSLHDVLEATGLAPLLDGAVTSAEVGAAKPDAAIFEAGLAAAGGVAPGEALHAGDTLEVDVEGARRAGLHAVHVLRDAEPGLVGATTIGDLSGLLDHPLYRQ